MPPAKDQAIEPLPSPHRKRFPVFTPMPTFSGSYQRTSSTQQLLHVITNIATIIAVWTILGTRRDELSVRFHSGSTNSNTP
jgi:hypothetical protein